MTDINYSIMLRHLVDDYFDHRLTRIEYVAQRRSLLDRIDYEFNGDVDTNGWPESDPSKPDAQQDNAEHDDNTDTSQINTIARHSFPNDDRDH